MSVAQCYPITRPVRSTEPTDQQEPINLEEAKKQCGISQSVDYHDTAIRRLISAAREQVEHDTGLVCYTGTYTWKQTTFPCADWLELPDIRPVTSITSITYIDGDGASQTWGSSNYSLHTSGVNQYLSLSYNSTWPSLRGDPNGITITMVAGYSNVLTVPKRVKQACLYLVNHWFANTDTVSVGTISSAIEMTYEALIRGLQRGTYP